MSSPPSGSDPARDSVVDEWVQIAEGDLATARREMSAPEPRNLRAVGFHLQQAIEKLMKGVLISRGARPPRTHDLELLDSLLRKAGVPECATREDLSRLSTAAVESRYPGEAISPDEARALEQIANTAWAKLRPLVQ